MTISFVLFKKKSTCVCMRVMCHQFASNLGQPYQMNSKMGASIKSLSRKAVVHCQKMVFFHLMLSLHVEFCRKANRRWMISTVGSSLQPKYRVPLAYPIYIFLKFYYTLLSRSACLNDESHKASSSIKSAIGLHWAGDLTPAVPSTVHTFKG